MKIIAVVTEDFALYHSVVKALKEDRIPFITLGLEDLIPGNVGVAITSRAEEDMVRHKPLVVHQDSVWLTIDRALHFLTGKDKYDSLVFGIDPGPRPGFAVLGDGDLLKTAQIETPEDVAPAISNAMSAFPANRKRARIGHGDPVMRNRILNALSNLEIELEVVDESHTSNRSKNPHVDAAVAIAMSSGVELHLPPGSLPVEPTEGEVREIQRRSRIFSDGRCTISREDGRLVARGEMTMEEAVMRRMGGNGTHEKE
ncbi:MAG: hypothetical protein QCI38_07750 [Candidatus Thermoplasmatota archaeon]|nr:hypothetical protein [Candidatus Thermoplasmatota archaeon]